MIKLALAVDADARALRKRFEDEVEAVDTVQYGLIAKARFAELGDSTYPDATFTLRLAFGTVKGLRDRRQDDPRLHDDRRRLRARRRPTATSRPYQLPPSWIDAKKARRLRLDTPLNFVSTADIIGGNSGSPVVNRQQRGRRPDLRRQHRLARPRLRLRRPPRPRRLGRLPRDRRGPAVDLPGRRSGRGTDRREMSRSIIGGCGRVEDDCRRIRPHPLDAARS